MTGGTKGSKPKFIIYKIADNKKSVEVEEVSEDPDYEVFRTKLEEAKDSKGNPAPRFGVYDVEYDLGSGEGKRYISILYECRNMRGLPLSSLTGARLFSSLGYLANALLSYVSVLLFHYKHSAHTKRNSGP